MKIKGFSKTFWILIMMLIIFGIIFWSVGGSRVVDEAPYYLKSVIGEASKVVINNQEFGVELARTERARLKGLSKRDYLAPDKGMLFIFDEPGIYSFTMKDTSISLDIIWILEDEITYIKSRAMPGEEIITPNNNANYVLEVRPGNASVGGWKVGDKVEINLD
ncbi:MAG: DUF192 domain-containing protein [Candidatus Kerfeldbacteria bacterium]|jgi:uncharacterized membrane protein (UPF0127 family)